MKSRTILPPLAAPQTRAPRHPPASDQQLGTRQHPAEPAGIVTRPAGALPPGTPAEIAASLHAHAQAAREQSSHLARLMKLLQGPRTLETATITIPAIDEGFEPGAPGVFTQDRYRVPFASVAVLNFGTTAVTVSSGPAQGSAPGGGQGQINVPATCFVALPLEGSQLTIYGTAGTLVTYCVMLDRCQPSAALLHT